MTENGAYCALRPKTPLKSWNSIENWPFYVKFAIDVKNLPTIPRGLEIISIPTEIFK